MRVERAGETQPKKYSHRRSQPDALLLRRAATSLALQFLLLLAS